MNNSTIQSKTISNPKPCKAALRYTSAPIRRLCRWLFIVSLVAFITMCCMGFMNAWGVYLSVLWWAVLCFFAEDEPLYTGKSKDQKEFVKRVTKIHRRRMYLWLLWMFILGALTLYSLYLTFLNVHSDLKYLCFFGCFWLGLFCVCAFSSYLEEWRLMKRYSNYAILHSSHSDISYLGAV